jgi:hypothetical protein
MTYDAPAIRTTGLALGPAPDATLLATAPQPSRQFRRQAWLKFQRRLDPFAPPEQLPPVPSNKARSSDY